MIRNIPKTVRRNRISPSWCWWSLVCAWNRIVPATPCLLLTWLLRRLQAQTVPDAAPPRGKIHPFSKIAVNFQPVMRLGWKHHLQPTALSLNEDAFINNSAEPNKQKDNKNYMTHTIYHKNWKVKMVNWDFLLNNAVLEGIIDLNLSFFSFSSM